MTFTSHPERGDSKHSEQDDMHEKAPEGGNGTSLAGTVPFPPSLPATVTVSTTSHALRFLTGNEIVDVEADETLTLTDVYEVER